MTIDLAALRMKLLPLLLAAVAVFGAPAGSMDRTEGTAQPELSSDRTAERAVAVRLAERPQRPLPPATDDDRHAVPEAGPATHVPATASGGRLGPGYVSGTGYAVPRFPTGPPSRLPRGATPA